MPRKKKNTPTRTRQSSGDDWLAWLATSDPQQREKLRAEVAKIKETEYDGVAALAKVMIEGLISGAVSPSVSQEARGWAEVMLASRATELALTRQDGGGNATASIILALGDIQKEPQKIEAHYTIDGEVETEAREFAQLAAVGATDVG